MKFSVFNLCFYTKIKECDLKQTKAQTNLGGNDLYKLVAIDIDGTLVNDHKQITKEVNDAIQAARAKGVKVVLCTGRPIDGIDPFIDELKLNSEDEYTITFNGALVQNTFTEEVFSETSLTYGDLKALYELSVNVESPMHYFDSANLYTPHKNINKYTVYESYINSIPLHYMPVEEAKEDMLIPKVMFIDEPDRLDKIIRSIPEEFRERYEMVQSAPFFLEILHPSVSKGNAVKKLAEKLGIQREEVICMGDGGNDLSMIEYAGCGVAMANAIPSIKEAAKFQTLSNNENGVAYAIQKLILDK